jgi:translation elongation factor EF-Ts
VRRRNECTNEFSTLDHARAMIVVRDEQDFVAKKAAFEDIARSWIAHV